jgi:hypothetical protein
MKKVQVAKIKHVKEETMSVAIRPRSSRIACGVAWILLLLCAGFIIGVQILPCMEGHTQERYLVFDAKFSSQNRTMVLCDTSHGGLDHIRGVQNVSLPPSEQFVPVRVPLSRGDVRYLQLNFLQESGTGTIRDFKIIDQNGSVLRTLDPRMLISLNPAAKTAVSGNTITIRHESQNDYPVFYVLTEYPIQASAPKVRVTAGSAWFVTLIMIVGFVISVDVFRRRHQITEPTTDDPQASLDWQLNPARWTMLWLLGLFALIWGAKLLVLRNFGMSLPNWDAWDGEGWQVYIPFFDHNLSWRDMFERVSDHRHFFDRLKALLLITINPQWDARFEVAINGAMHAAIGCGIVAIVWHLFEKRNLLYISVIALPLFALPYSFSPQLQAFWTPYYFLQGFGVLTLWLVMCHPPFSSRWLLGLTCAICSIFTLSSGVLAAAVVVVVSLALLAKDRQAWRHHTVSAIAGFAVIALAIPFFPTGHLTGGIPAQSVAGFLQAFLNVAAWPTLLPALSVVLWLPWLVLGWCVWREPGRPSNVNMFLLSLGLWALFQAAGVAACRNDTAIGYMTERHMSIINLGALVNALAGIAVCDHVRFGGKAHRFQRAMMAIWWGTFLVGFAVMFLDTTMERLWAFRVNARSAAATSRAFAATDDPRIILASSGEAVPIVNRPLLALSTLRNRWIRQILPEVTPALALNPAPGFEKGGFKRNVFPQGLEMGGRTDAWSSYSPERASGAAVFQSGNVQAGRARYVQIDVAGRLGAKGQCEGMSLVLRGQNGEVVKVPGGRQSDGEWRSVVARCPRSDFCLVAIDQRQDTWFGFAEVRTVSVGSAGAFWVVEKAPFILGGGLALLACLIIGRGWNIGNRRKELSSICDVDA